jgi:hypothetical protein
MWINAASIYPHNHSVSIVFVIKEKITFQMLTILKNIHFTRLVKAGSSLKEFNFRKLGYANVPTFHVDVTDDRANRIVFTMQKLEGSWIMTPLDLPKWIKEVCTSLNQILEETNKEETEMTDGI